ncbi:hypothetical protein [Leptospira santarosai]|uniref:hypothetical protein n=1 Tax=Leptospira santarosai TaxID=28183 RepID=UPI0018E0EF8E|nr:hypothetical protein [Leptospira santarosai]
MGTAAFSFRILKQTLNQENLARYGSLIFTLQRTNILFRPNSANAFLRIGVQGETMSLCTPRLLVISLAMDRSSLLCKEPTLSLRGFWLSRSLWIAHLCFAKNQRFRSAAFGYLARYGSLIFALQRTNAFAPRLLVISLAMDRSIGRKT